MAAGIPRKSAACWVLSRVVDGRSVDFVVIARTVMNVCSTKTHELTSANEYHETEVPEVTAVSIAAANVSKSSGSIWE